MLGSVLTVRAALNQAGDVQQPRPFLKGKLVDLGLVRRSSNEIKEALRGLSVHRDEPTRTRERDDEAVVTHQ